MVAIGLDRIVTLTQRTPGHRDEHGYWIQGEPVRRQLWARLEALDDVNVLEIEGIRGRADIRLLVRYDAALLNASRDDQMADWTIELDGQRYAPSSLAELPRYRREYMQFEAVKGT